MHCNQGLVHDTIFLWSAAKFQFPFPPFIYEIIFLDFFYLELFMKCPLLFLIPMPNHERKINLFRKQKQNFFKYKSDHVPISNSSPHKFHIKDNELFLKSYVQSSAWCANNDFICVLSPTGHHNVHVPAFSISSEISLMY